VFGKILPKTILPVQIAIVVTAILFLGGAVHTLINFADAEAIQLAFAVFFCIVSINLWLLKPWARTASQWLLGVIVFIVVVGIFFNPFFLTDYEAANGGAEPNWVVLYADMFLGAVPAAWCWWVFHRHFAAFQSSSRT
jgi:hypothetical protein